MASGWQAGTPRPTMGQLSYCCMVMAAIVWARLFMPNPWCRLVMVRCCTTNSALRRKRRPHRSFGWEDAPDVGAAIAYLRSRPELASARLGIAAVRCGAQIALQRRSRYPSWCSLADWFRSDPLQRQPCTHQLALAIAYLSNWIIDPLLSAASKSRSTCLDRDYRQYRTAPDLPGRSGNSAPYFGMKLPACSVLPNMRRQCPGLDHPGSTHCDGPSQRPQEYATRLVEFFNQRC